jgi:uncharacterized OsmC-like protein
MKGEELRDLQAPLKARYRETPAAALITLKAEGELGDTGLTCKVDTGRALVEAGLHPATGGDGLSACSGDMLLEALVACAGVTLQAVATAIDLPLRGGRVRAEGDLDFRGTLGVAKDAPVGFRAIRLAFEIDSDADPAHPAQPRGQHPRRRELTGVGHRPRVAVESCAITLCSSAATAVGARFSAPVLRSAFRRAPRLNLGANRSPDRRRSSGKRCGSPSPSRRRSGCGASGPAPAGPRATRRPRRSPERPACEVFGATRTTAG